MEDNKVKDVLEPMSQNSHLNAKPRPESTIPFMHALVYTKVRQGYLYFALEADK